MAGVGAPSGSRRITSEVGGGERTSVTTNAASSEEPCPGMRCRRKKLMAAQDRSCGRPRHRRSRRAAEDLRDATCLRIRRAEPSFASFPVQQHPDLRPAALRFRQANQCCAPGDGPQFPARKPPEAAGDRTDHASAHYRATEKRNVCDAVLPDVLAIDIVTLWLPGGRSTF
jgi:hypothetical protein